MINDRLPALHVASKLRHYEIVRRLLPICKINLQDIEGLTALHYAAMRGDCEIARLLLSAEGVNVNIQSLAAKTRAKTIHPIYSNAPLAVAKSLIEKGSDIETENSTKETPLLSAAAMGHEKMVRLLIEKGANIEAKNKFNETALSTATWAGHEAVVRLLIERGANLESRADHGDTPLSIAASKGYAAITELLVDKGANIEAKCKSGYTPLAEAAHSGHETVARLLIEKGADFNLCDVEDTIIPLTVAAEMGHEAIVRLLAERGGRCGSQR